MTCQDKCVAHCGAICSPIMPVAMDAGPSIRKPRNAYSPNAAAASHCASVLLMRLRKQETLELMRNVYHCFCNKLPALE